jgi:hypothetical protein
MAIRKSDLGSCLDFAPPVDIPKGARDRCLECDT